MNKTLIFSVFILLASGYSDPVVSDTGSLLSILMKPQEKEAVLAGEIITTAYLKNHNTISTHPHSAVAQVPITPYTGDADYSAYEMIAIEKAFIPYRLDTEKFLSIYNNLSAYAKLAGTNYYSRSEAKYLPFIVTSYRVSSPESNIPVADITYQSIPAEQISYFQIKDNRFGKLLFASNVYTEGNNVVMRNLSLRPMAKLFFPINEAGEYELTYFFLYDHKAKGFFYYALHAMRIRSDFFLQLSQLTPQNFANRIRAVTVRMADYFGLDWRDRLNPFP